jgi:hypothetical protein
MDEGVAPAVGSGQQRVEAFLHVHSFALGTIQLGVHQRYAETSVDGEAAEPVEASCGEEWFPLQHRRWLVLFEYTSHRQIQR